MMWPEEMSGDRSWSAAPLRSRPMISTCAPRRITPYYFTDPKDGSCMLRIPGTSFHSGNAAELSAAAAKPGHCTCVSGGTCAKRHGFVGLL